MRKAEEREQIPNLREAAEQVAKGIQILTKAGISQEDIESIDRPFYDPVTRRIRFSKPENNQKLKEYEHDDMAIKDLEQEPCEDAISREKTLTAFADYVGSGMSMNDYDALWDIVAKMPSVNQQEPKWIPVSDRLPEFNGRYLVSLPSRLIHEEYNVMILNFAKSLHGVPNKEAWYEVDSNMVLNEVPGVIAWMPLPEPYKESEE